jgi:hypothetical protein
MKMQYSEINIIKIRRHNLSEAASQPFKLFSA